jgi:hypothetical protein
MGVDGIPGAWSTCGLASKLVISYELTIFGWRLAAVNLAHTKRRNGTDMRKGIANRPKPACGPSLLIAIRFL